MRHSRIGKARGVVGTGAARRMTRPGGKAASTSESGVPGSADLPPVSPTHRSGPRQFGLRGVGVVSLAASAAGTWCPDVKGTKVDEALSLGWENLFGRLDGPMSFPGAHQAGGSHAPRDPCWIEGCATASPPSWRPFSRMRLSATICCARAGRMWTPFSSSPSSWTRSVRVASWPRHPPRTATTGRDTYR